jgi:hypothetical protein
VSRLRHFFTADSQTFIENWPIAIQQLSINQRSLRLSINEARALGSNCRGYEHWFSNDGRDPIEFLTCWLCDQIKYFPTGCFVRLGSRSGKDSDFALATGMKVNSVRSAIQMLTDGSERIATDLRNCIRFNYQPTIFLREWCDLEPWGELRCFIKNRQLVGISQIDGHLGITRPILVQQRSAIEKITRLLCKKTIEHLHVADVIVDAFIVNDKDVKPVSAKILELNPYSTRTGAALFDWDGPFDNTFRCNEN